MTADYEAGYTQGFADALEGRMEAVAGRRLEGEERRAEIRGILNQAFSKGANKGFDMGVATGERRGFRKGYSKGKLLVWTRAIPKAKGQGRGV